MNNLILPEGAKDLPQREMENDPPPLPIPTPEELEMAKLIADELAVKINTPGLKAALLNQESLQGAIAVWTNIISQEIASHLCLLDRKQILGNLNNQLLNQKVVKLLQPNQIRFDPQTVNYVTQLLVQILQGLQPPVLYFRPKNIEERGSEGQDSKVEKKVTPQEETT